MLKEIYKNHSGKVSDRKQLNNTNTSIMDQSNNPWSNSNLLPEEELVLLKKK